MRVRATEEGFFNHIYRRSGDEFEIQEKAQYSHRWMEAVDFEPPPDRYADAKPDVRNELKRAKPKVKKVEKAQPMTLKDAAKEVI